MPINPYLRQESLLQRSAIHPCMPGGISTKISVKLHMDDCKLKLPSHFGKPGYFNLEIVFT